jgi:hypothetical protein
MILGVKTAIRAMIAVEGMDRMGPPYLMARVLIIFMRILGKLQFRGSFPSLRFHTLT